MIDILLTPHWRNVAAVNPRLKVQEDLSNTRVNRFKGFTLRSIEERTKRRDSGRYPVNILTKEVV